MFIIHINVSRQRSSSAATDKSPAGTLLGLFQSPSGRSCRGQPRRPKGCSGILLLNAKIFLKNKGFNSVRVNYWNMPTACTIQPPTGRSAVDPWKIDKTHMTCHTAMRLLSVFQTMTFCSSTQSVCSSFVLFYVKMQNGINH